MRANPGLFSVSVAFCHKPSFPKGAIIWSMNIEYTVQIWKEGSQFVAHAMPLDVMSSGKTPQEAGKALDEALHLFLVTATDMGTLPEVLQECGYELQEGQWVCPVWVATERRSAAVGV
jgi:predicted RNase H-like HicB family nuclease